MKRTEISFFKLALAMLPVVFAATACMAQNGPKVSVKALLVPVSGDTVTVLPGSQADQPLSVPLSADFQAVLETDDGKEYVMFPQWTVTRSVVRNGQTVTEQFLKRQESGTHYDFREYGTFQVSFEWSYRETDQTETVPGESVEPMTFTIDNSELKLYNTFTPNGDGYNDVCKIYMRSIVRASISIFNRWGQPVRTLSGTMDKLIGKENEPDADGGYLIEVWDGTHNGKVVSDGVYFIHVKATGAGGREYDEKADINVLTGLPQE